MNKDDEYLICDLDGFACDLGEDGIPMIVVKVPKDDDVNEDG